LIDDDNTENPFEFLLTNMAPVLIAEEWLIKFGFTLVDYHITVPYYNKSTEMDIGIEVAKNNMQVTVTNDSNESVLLINIKYVHQLQNLYFTLTNEELTLT
jgi:Fe-S cluster assembly iron-binding protein IscA